MSVNVCICMCVCINVLCICLCEPVCECVWVCMYMFVCLHMSVSVSVWECPPVCAEVNFHFKCLLLVLHLVDCQDLPLRPKIGLATEPLRSANLCPKHREYRLIHLSVLLSLLVKSWAGEEGHHVWFEFSADPLWHISEGLEGMSVIKNNIQEKTDSGKGHFWLLVVREVW